MSDEPEMVYVPFPPFAGWVRGFDPTTVDLFAARLTERKSGVTSDQLARAVEIATRYAAVDTGAIEGLYETNRGFTRTIATQSAAWEAALRMHDDVVARSIEDALAGYEYVLDAAARATPISEVWVRQLHEVLCRSQETYTVYTAVGPQQQPLPRGRYKSMPNSPTNVNTGRLHHYAPVDDTPAEMARFVEELRSEAFAAAHPVLQAAYAHYAFVCVHPFADGNGRVSRALASAFLYRNPGVPLVVFADQKDVYIDALEAADAGDPNPFVSFMEQRTLDAVDLVLTNLELASQEDADVAAERMARESTGPAGISHGDMDAINVRLTTLVQQNLEARSSRIDVGAGVRFQYFARESPPTTSPPRGYRAQGGSTFSWVLTGPAPAGVGVQGRMGVWTRFAGQQGPEFAVVDELGARRLDVNLRDIHPAQTQLLDIKLAAWVDRFFDLHMTSLATQTHEQLVARGYLPPETDS